MKRKAPKRKAPKRKLAAKDNPVYQLADRLTPSQIKTECIGATGTFADHCRLALGRSTVRALNTTEYGARLAIARRILRTKKLWSEAKRTIGRRKK